MKGGGEFNKSRQGTRCMNMSRGSREFARSRGRNRVRLAYFGKIQGKSNWSRPGPLLGSVMIRHILAQELDSETGLEDE
jgi:hypothetical protein